MKLTVFGATGRTGGHVVRLALAAGHHVTAVVRDPGRLPVPPHSQLDVVRADVMDPDAIVPAVLGRDAVVSALGTHDRGPTSICTDAARSVSQAMHVAGVWRLVAVGASGPFIDDGDGPVMRVLLKPLVMRMLRHGFADFRNMEEMIRRSGLDWTVMRPPRLTDGPARGRYRTALDRNIRRGFLISRADLADAILRALDDSRTAGHTIGVAY